MVSFYLNRDWVKDQQLLADNVPLKQWLKSLEEEDEEDNVVVKTRNKGQALQGLVNPNPLLDKKIPEKCFYSEYSDTTLQEIMDEQMQMVRALKKFGKSKHLANRFKKLIRVLIIFDDLVGSTLFSMKKENPFKKLNTNHRHYSASILMVSQAYKEIPMIFEIPNDKELEVIFEENSLYMKRHDWMEAYQYAVEGDHDFLFINYQKPKRLRMMKNFEQVLFVDK